VERRGLFPVTLEIHGRRATSHPLSLIRCEVAMEKIRVIIVDEQPLFREGIHYTLERLGHCEIVGESTNPAEILELARTTRADVALIDAGLTRTDALELAYQLRHQAPHIAVIILTPSEDEERLFQSIKVGAAAYYTRNISPEELIEAVQRVTRGEYLINDDVLSRPQIAGRVLKSFREMTVADEESDGANSGKDLYSPLSSREVEILDYIARGNSNKEIAKSLKISDQTVKNHITSILKKLSVNDRTAAVVHALRHGWIKIQDG
jgi:DNA-binding NarL/FixJ family response regulator